MYPDTRTLSESVPAVRSFERAAASYERQIRIAEARGDGVQARTLYDEYETFLVAWRAQEELLGLLPDASDLPTPHTVGSDVKRRLRKLLEEISPFSAELSEGRPSQAAALYVIGHSEEALSRLDRLLGLVRDEAQLQRRRGQCQIQLRRWREALQSFSRALDLEASNPIALAGKGLALHKLGHSEEALVQFGRSLEVAPQVAETHFRVGDCLLALERGGLACLALDRAVALAPECRVYREKRARALLSEGRLMAAAQALEDDPDASARPPVESLTGELPARRSRSRSGVSTRQRRTRRSRRRRRRLMLLGAALLAGIFCGWLSNSYLSYSKWSKGADHHSAQGESRLRQSQRVLQVQKSGPYDPSRAIR